MGDVLKAEVYPAEGFDSNSPGRFYVKYVASTNPKMTVNLSTDPRSGEITAGASTCPKVCSTKSAGAASSTSRPQTPRRAT